MNVCTAGSNPALSVFFAVSVFSDSNTPQVPRDMKIAADANIPFVKECFSSMGDVTIYAGRQITPAVAADADILLVRSVTRVNQELLEGSRVRFVATATIGTDHVDIEYLSKRKIGFAAAPGSNSNSVAEYIVAALLTIAERRRITLSGKSLGIIGVGNVGSRVAQKAESLGMKLILNDPPLQRQTGDPKYLPLEKLYNCDFITFHTPLTHYGIDKTFHLADETLFSSLKDGTVFLNTARGGVMDTAALKAALKTKRVSAAVLDVWENEPNIDAELLEMADIAAPHIAGYSYDGKVAGMIMIYLASCQYFNIRPHHTINDFLPKPPIPSIELNATSGDEQEIIRQAVKKIYDIEADDQRMREILNVPTYNRGKLFDELRKTYPVRREFQNTSIVLADKNSTLAKKFAGIGFRIA
jgi:erythronate-4-phosphate dehydrogenase